MPYAEGRHESRCAPLVDQSCLKRPILERQSLSADRDLCVKLRQEKIYWRQVGKKSNNTKEKNDWDADCNAIAFEHSSGLSDDDNISSIEKKIQRL